MKKILIIDPIHDEGIKLFKDNQSFQFEIIDSSDQNLVKDKIKNCDGLTVRTSLLTKDIIDAGNKLKIVCNKRYHFLNTAPLVFFYSYFSGSP